MVSAREVADLLDERPDLEPAVEAVLEPEPPWDFHDLDVDSGRFGELVASGVVEQTDDGYRVADPEAVVEGLEGPTETGTTRQGLDLREIDLDIDRLEVGFLFGAIALVVAFRVFAWPTVFREGHIVLSGNDPYYYRYWVEQLLTDPDIQLSTLPDRLTKGEPFLVATLWLFSLFLGGTTEATGHVMAWYPVVTAVLTALLVYGITVHVTDDRRIGLSAVAMLAVLPGHAFRTSLGFADHHPFDYLWLSLTLLGIVFVIWASTREESPVEPTTLTGVSMIAIGLAAQTLAWDNSALIVAALAPYLAFEGLRSVHADEPPSRTLGPLIVGIGIATAIAWTAHNQFGWHTELVLSAPLLVLLGGLGVLLAAELFHRQSLSAGALAVAEAGVAGVILLGLSTLRPEMWARLTTSIQERLLAPRPIAEVQSIFSEAGGWLLLFGFILFIGLPYLAWATYQAIEEPRWTPLVIYGWYFFVLSSIQARFVGELSPVIAIFAGLAFVHLAERVDLTSRPAPFTDINPPELSLPEPRQAGYLLALFILIAGLSMLQVPVKTSQVSTHTGLSDTAFYLADDSDERNLTYPENYVFSEWDKNRVYNYFVNGESQSYGYAQANFDRFLVSTEAEAWYGNLVDRVGYIVVTSRATQTDPPQSGALLYTHLGSATDSHRGLKHYRLIFVSETGEYKAFELVPGAVIAGQTDPNSTVEASTTVSVPGQSFTYTRQTTADASGSYELRVANPGTYDIGNATVTVSESAVRNGTTVEVNNSSA